MKDYIKNVSFLKPNELPGKNLTVILNDGGVIDFNVNRSDERGLHGHDDEGMSLFINLEDIDYIIGGK